jgi:hypothetical protein
MADISKIVALITDANIKAIKDGNTVTLNLANIPEAKLEDLVKMAIHCCCNGPIGVGRKVKFPHKEGLTSIKEVWPELTSGPWKQFCLIVAAELNKHPDSIKGSYTLRFGGLWPFCDNSFVPKPRDKDGNRINTAQQNAQGR